MENVKKPIKSFASPQLNDIPYSFIKSVVEEYGFEAKPVLLAVNQLKGTQGEVDLNQVKQMSEIENSDSVLPPIWVSENLKILDGHHTVASKKLREGDNAKQKCIRISANDKDGVSLLKIAQDRWEQKQKGLYK